MIPEIRRHFFFEPKWQELFSSWLLRLCAKAHLSPHAFGMHWFGQREIWTRDIDRRIWPEEAILFAAKIGVNPDIAMRACLSFRMGWEVSSAPGFTPGLLALGMYHRLHRRHGLVFCPECLAADGEPYYRIDWRLAPSLICPTHSALLHDACERCDGPVSPHRATQIGIHRCHSCGHDLCKQGVQKPSAVMLANFLSLQIRLSVETDTSLQDQRELLGRLRLCWRLLLESRTAPMFRRAASASGIDLPSEPTDQWHQLEYSRITLRRRWLPIAALILEEWPGRLQTICKDAGLTQRMILESTHPVQDAAWAHSLVESLKPSPERKAKVRKRAGRRLAHKKAFRKVGLATAVQMQFPNF